MESLAQPGGNFTGVTYSEFELGGKRLELLLEAAPGRQKSPCSGILRFRDMPTPWKAPHSGFARGVEVFSRELKGIEELEPAFDDAVRAKAKPRCSWLTT